MGQFIFFALFITALLVVAFAHFAPSHRFVNPVEFFSDKSGYTTVQEHNSKSIQQVNVTTGQGLTQVRRQMTDLVQTQKTSSKNLEEQRSLQYARNLIDEEHQKDQDQQRINQQQARDQAQQILDQQEQERIYQQQFQDKIQRMKDQR